MEKTNIPKQFAHRLREAMIDAGFDSARSSSGVSIHKLGEITGYSLQICRKYLRGEAIPEPAKLVEIASALSVTAGWLLFGENYNDELVNKDKVIISKNLLYYIFTKAGFLYGISRLEEEAPDFLMELIQDLSQISANDEQSKKIIDLTLASVKHFKPETVCE